MLRRAVRVAACVGRGVHVTLARSFAVAASWTDGLIGPSSTDDHYARQLDLQLAAELVTTPGLLWQAAKADVVRGGGESQVEAYVERVEQAAAAFIRRRELHDREAITAILRKVLNNEGQLVLALGGKSVGKSFILTKLAEELKEAGPLKKELLKRADDLDTTAAEMRNEGNVDSAEGMERRASELRTAAAIGPRRVVVYNARHDGADLVKGLLKAFRSDASFFVKYSAHLSRLAELGTGAGVLTTVEAVSGPLGASAAVPAAAKAGKAVGDTVGRLLSSFDVSSLDLSDVVEAFVATCEAEGSFPCLVVDEANAALVASSEAAKDRTVAALRLLTEYTKERNRMNAILASSEYAEPYRLSALGFKSDHFTDTVLVPEVPPKDMRALLEGKWGMGPHLATAFMSVWGGHIWSAAKGIQLLAADKANFAAIKNPIAFSADALDGVGTCLASDAHAQPELAAMIAEGGTLMGMTDMLREIGISGYAPVQLRADPRAELTGRCNVGGVVTVSTRAPGVPAEAWAGDPAAIVVATNQAMRMLLASRLRAAGRAGA